jgi:hypothetical protein
MILIATSQIQGSRSYANSASDISFQSSNGQEKSKSGIEIGQPPQRIKGEVIHQGMNPFFQWLNGKLVPKNPENPTLYESTSGYLQNITKTLWTTTPIIQAFGLVSKRANMFARAIYGTCWSVVYSCLRPLKADAELLTDEGATKPISDTVKTFDRANEHFRLGMGSIVTAFYGSGAVGMLWNAITGNEEGFESASKLYQKGMLDQNQVFASMNTSICMKRKYNANQLPEDDRTTGNVKSTAEFIDSILFLPNVIARGIDTVDFFGWHVGDGLGKIINSLGYFSYGTWAARFGFVKGQEFKGAGALEPKNEDLTGSLKTIDDALYNTQKYGAETFKYSLPALSFISSGLELFGLRDLAKQVFSFEGILERLNPTISAWCLRSPVMTGLMKTPKVESLQSAQTQAEQTPDIQTPEVRAEVKPEANAGASIEINTEATTTAASTILASANKTEITSERIQKVKLFLKGKIKEDREIIEDIFIAGNKGLVEWKVIIGACIKGTITLSMVQSHMNYFTDERILDKALEEAHLTISGRYKYTRKVIKEDVPGKSDLIPFKIPAAVKPPVEFEREIHRGIVEFTRTGDLTKGATIEHVIESAKRGYISWQAAFRGFTLNKNQQTWESFLDKIVDESIPLEELKQNRLVFAKLREGVTVDNSQDERNYDTDTTQYFDIADIVYIKHHHVLDSKWGVAV